ncbi:MAG: Mpo1-like protein, partial [Betaproteobacteria bacterium]
FGALLYAAESIAALPLGAGIAWFLVLFAGGWVVQLVGHMFEGRKPALVDNLFQIFVAPIFLCAEAFFALGYKPGLHAAVQRRALQMRAQAGIGHAAPA